MVLVHCTSSQRPLSICEKSSITYSTFGTMLWTRISDQGEIIQELGKVELWLLCTALSLNVLYQSAKTY